MALPLSGLLRDTGDGEGDEHLGLAAPRPVRALGCDLKVAFDDFRGGYGDLALLVGAFLVSDFGLDVLVVNGFHGFPGALDGSGSFDSFPGIIGGGPGFLRLLGHRPFLRDVPRFSYLRALCGLLRCFFSASRFV